MTVSLSHTTQSDTEEVPAEEAQEEQGEEQDEVTTTFKQYAREEEGLMKTSAYTALCCLGHNPSVLDVNKFYEEKSKGGELQYWLLLLN